MTIDDRGYTPWTWAALAMALATTAGSLGLSLALNLKACPLCFYQRTFVMGVVAVLLMGLLAGQPRVASLLALPLAVAGLSVALFHVRLEVIGRLECPVGFLGLGTAPQQALAAQAPLAVLLLIDVLRPPRWLVSGVALALGVLLAWACVVSSPPMRQPPTRPYEAPLDECRPPFVAT